MTSQLAETSRSLSKEVTQEPKLDEIEQRLRSSSYLALRFVRCWLDGRTIMIDGRVPSYHLKQIAQSLVGNLSEGRTIENRLEVA